MIIDMIHQGLLQDIQNFDVPHGFRSDKAARVYFLCVERRHTKLAMAIHDKYGKPTTSDLVMAFAHVLYANQTVNK